MVKTKDKCSNCGSTQSRTFWDYSDETTLCDACENKVGIKWGKNHNKLKQSKIPLELNVKIYFGLLLGLLIFLLIYYTLYVFGGIILLGVGIIPLIIAFFILNKEEGIIVSQKNQPELFKIIQDVCYQTGVAIPKSIYLTPYTGIGVSGLLEKKLTIGIVGLRALTVEEFKSILAHEMGHINGKDTMIGGFFYRIQVALEGSSEVGRKFGDIIPLLELAIIGYVVMLFCKIYSFILGLIFLFYSRNLEYRADLIASQIYGGKVFASALLNYSAFTHYFDEVAASSIITLANDNKQFVNVYSWVYENYKKEDTAKIRNILYETSSEGIFSTHPPLKKRIDKICEKSNCLISGKKVIEVINDLEEIEKEFNNKLTEAVKVNYINAIVEDVKQREGKCRYCGEQFKTVGELLEHEAKHQEQQ